MNPRSPNNHVIQDALEFINLFGGLDRINQIGAFGTGAGQWVKRPLTYVDVAAHLGGEGAGIGIPPLGPDNCVMFAAIDLDEPDFDAAREMQEYIPGKSWIERSRSGNAHVWVFFNAPLEAWVAMGILKEATEAAGKTGVEVFPKNHDFSKVKYGNYINLPYHGYARPIVDYDPERSSDPSGQWAEYRLEKFVSEATEGRSDPSDWRDRARWLLIEAPEKRERKQEFGTQPMLHTCAEHIIANRDENPVTSGHRNAVFFALAKMLSNCSLFDHDEALEMMRLVNESSDDTPTPRTTDRELRRILNNAEQGEYTSYGCDDPLVLPYADPNCPIAHPRR